MNRTRIPKILAVLSAVVIAVAIPAVNLHGETMYVEVIDESANGDGTLLRLVVPSIIFGPDAGEFGGIDPGTTETNDTILGRIAEVLNRFEGYSIRIEGHANPTTPPGTELRAEEETGSPNILGLQPLSEERAQTVLEHLVDLGVERDRLSAVGMGGARVLVEYEDRDDWWRNRRVEFLLTRK